MSAPAQDKHYRETSRRITTEMAEQNRMWPEQRYHGPMAWLGIMGKQVGHYSGAVLDHHAAPDVHKRKLALAAGITEAVQIAAVAANAAAHLMAQLEELEQPDV